MRVRYAGYLLAIICLVTPSISRAQAAKDQMARAALHDGMRQLWEDHITWTRLYIVSVTADLPDKDATTQRLLQNQTDIGNAIKPYYGEAAGTKLTGLLKSHILIAAEIIDAARKGDAAKKDNAAKRWQVNADDLAAFLNGANPKNWPLADLKRMLRSHLDLTTSEVVAHLTKDWAGDVTAYDKVHAEILTMADVLSAGIVTQFPKKF